MKIGSIVWGVKDIDRAVRFWSEALHYRLREPASEDWAVLVPIEGDGIQLSLSKVTSDKAKRHHMDLLQTASSRRCSGFWRWGRLGQSGFIPPTQIMWCCTTRMAIHFVLYKNRKSEKVGREKGGIWIDYQRIVAEIHHGRHLHRGWGNCLPQFRQQDGGCGAVCQRTVYHLHLGV